MCLDARPLRPARSDGRMVAMADLRRAVWLAAIGALAGLSSARAADGRTPGPEPYLAPGAALSQPEPRDRPYARGQQGAEKSPGVIGGSRIGAMAADVSRTRNYWRVDDDVEPAVRCWWNRVDVWNGYDHIPRRVRVCN